MRIYHTEGAIRKATKDDAKTLARWWSDGAVMEHAGFPFGIKTDIDKLEKKLAHQSNEDILWIIEGTDDTPIGEMHYQVDGEKASLGIKICEASQQNKGLGKIVLKRMIFHIFTTTNANYIWLDTMIENTRAQHVYESLHFKKMNISKDCWKDQLGHLRTAVEYKLTKETFNKYEAFFKAHQIIR